MTAKKPTTPPEASAFVAPPLTDEPGKITKLTGRDSVQSRGKKVPVKSDKQSFVTGKQKKLGEVDLEAAKVKSGDPQRFVPKRTLADGTKPRKGMQVLHRNGTVGTVAVTYQIACAVKLTDGTVKTMSYSTLNKGVQP
jgi:hypothetical protein